MKLITILFSIYIITLSCLPCADADTNVEKNTVSFQSENNSTSGHQHEDACSPFCICSCCHCNGFYESNDYIKSALTINTFIEKQAIEYTSTLFSNFQNSIWQPPQIS